MNTALITTTKLVPPLTKNEVLRATARALYQQHEKLRAETQKKSDSLRQIRDKKLEQLARKQLRSAVPKVSSSWRSNDNFTVEFQVDVPRKSVESEDNAWRGFVVVPHKSEDHFLKELREAQAMSEDRVGRLLDDKSIRAKLLEMGRKVLGIAESQKPSTAISK